MAVCWALATCPLFQASVAASISHPARLDIRKFYLEYLLMCKAKGESVEKSWPYSHLDAGNFCATGHKLERWRLHGSCACALHSVLLFTHLQQCLLQRQLFRRRGNDRGSDLLEHRISPLS